MGFMVTQAFDEILKPFLPSQLMVGAIGNGRARLLCRILSL